MLYCINILSSVVNNHFKQIHDDAFHGFYVFDFIAHCWDTFSAPRALLSNHIMTNKDDDDDDDDDLLMFTMCRRESFGCWSPLLRCLLCRGCLFISSAYTFCLDRRSSVIAATYCSATYGRWLSGLVPPTAALTRSSTATSASSFAADSIPSFFVCDVHVRGR